MLKLLRRVRQKFVDEGNLKRYLFYAIGEIFLVMIGILLALQVSNWNQQKIDDQKELKALTDLNKEFKLNFKRIRTKQNSRLSIVPTLDKYIQLIATGKADYQAFKDLHSSQMLFGMTNPSNGVIDALISSGEIALISNDLLKYLLADWKNQLENLYENEGILWDSGLEYLRSPAEKIPSPSHTWSDWDDEKLASAFNDFSTNISYRNKLIGFEGTNRIVIEECDMILNALENILILLDKEIKSKGKE